MYYDNWDLWLDNQIAINIADKVLYIAYHLPGRETMDMVEPDYDIYAKVYEFGLKPSDISFNFSEGCEQTFVVVKETSESPWVIYSISKDI